MHNETVEVGSRFGATLALLAFGNDGGGGLRLACWGGLTSLALWSCCLVLSILGRALGAATTGSCCPSAPEGGRTGLSELQTDPQISVCWFRIVL